MEDDDWKQLTAEVGKVVEDAGRMLQRRPALSKQDLTGLCVALDHAAATIRVIRKAA